MVKIPDGSNTIPRRGAGLRGVGVFRQGPSGMVFSAWPKARGAPKSDAQAQAQKDFGAAVVIVKNMDPLIQDFAREVAKGSPLLPRDLLMGMLYNKLWYLVLRSGRKIYSVASYQDVSLLLDAIGQVPGTIMYRDESWWKEVPPGTVDWVLTMLPSGLPGWAPATGGGGGGGDLFMAPGLLEMTGGGTVGTGYFEALPIVPSQAHVIHGIRYWCQDPGSGALLQAGLYGSSSNTLPAGVLHAEGPQQTSVLGMNELAFTTPFTVTPWVPYWLGIAVNGGGSGFKLANAEPTRNDFYYFAHSSGPLPDPAPACFFGTGANQFTWWAY